MSADKQAVLVSRDGNKVGFLQMSAAVHSPRNKQVFIEPNPNSSDDKLIIKSSEPFTIMYVKENRGNQGIIIVKNSKGVQYELKLDASGGKCCISKACHKKKVFSMRTFSMPLSEDM